MKGSATDEDRKIIRDYLEIREDYAPDRSIFSEEPDKLRRVKEIIARLPPADRVLFVMYTDCGSLRKLAARFGISYVTLQKEIARIRKTILKQYDPNL